LGNPPLSVSLVSLDKAEYALGDEIIYILRVENTREYPTRVPTRVSLAEIEPEDASLSYRYEPMEIWLHLKDHEKHTLNTLLIVLYGSVEKPSTQLELQPKEWIEIRGKASLQPTAEKGRVVYSGYGTHSDMPPPVKKMSELEVSVSVWKGDVVDFDATTRQENYPCTVYEMGSTIYGSKLSLLPAAKR